MRYLHTMVRVEDIDASLISIATFWAWSNSAAATAKAGGLR
jgi:hypothetical protein